MLKQKQCPVCSKVFTPKTYKHCFCTRKCFYINYKRNQKSKQYPNYICPDCGTKTRLTFFPRLSRAKWSKFKCPNCSKENSDNDYQEIKSIKLSFKIEEFIDGDNLDV